MANYCNNKIAIIGYDKDKVDSIRKLMVESFRESRNGTVRDFFIKCGYSKDEAIKITDGRDTFIDIDDEIDKKTVSTISIFRLRVRGILMWRSLLRLLKKSSTTNSNSNIVQKSLVWGFTLILMRTDYSSLIDISWIVA